MHGERLPPLETSEPQGLSNLVSPDYGTETVLLPHQHHNSLRNSIFILSTPAVPLTSLNVFLLHILTTARTSIFILSPNLTAPPVLSALLAAVERGVNVHIISNKRMMLLEQLVTAGTITEICVWKLARDYKKLLSRQRRNSRDLEQGRENVGALRIEYFKPLQKRPERSTYDQEANALPAGPQKSHIKCTIVDDRVVVLGSGNMDRASWFTSQELGIGFIGTEVVAKVWKDIDAWLEGRVEGYFPRW